ncbi:MAG: energy transducer TonB [Muribaculaceae bacterium]|nr:energy transducer TonB [Muribaculaceae bacterium]
MRRFLLLITVMLSAMSVSVAMADDPATKQVEEVVEEELWVVEARPQFPGGDLALMEWIKQNMVYPQEAIAKGIEGRVIVKFTVEEDGTVTNGEIMKGVDPLLDNEALRLVSIMPKWSPGSFDGKDMRFTYNLPLLSLIPQHYYKYNFLNT